MRTGHANRGPHRLLLSTKVALFAVEARAIPSLGLTRNGTTIAMKEFGEESSEEKEEEEDETVLDAQRQRSVSCPHLSLIVCLNPNDERQWAAGLAALEKAVRRAAQPPFEADTGTANPTTTRIAGVLVLVLEEAAAHASGTSERKRRQAALHAEVNAHFQQLLSTYQRERHTESATAPRKPSVNRFSTHAVDAPAAQPATVLQRRRRLVSLKQRLRGGAAGEDFSDESEEYDPEPVPSLTPSLSDEWARPSRVVSADTATAPVLVVQCIAVGAVKQVLEAVSSSYSSSPASCEAVEVSTCAVAAAVNRGMRRLLRQYEERVGSVLHACAAH